MTVSEKLSLSQKVRGHYMTLQPFFARSLRPPLRPETEHWETELEDPDVGTVKLTGRLLKRSSREIVVVLHGLGGHVESGYMGLMLAAAETEGRSCLLLNNRGADRSGADIYHSGLIADIEAALASEALAGFDSIDLVGYSIGGHIALRYGASDQVDARVRRLAAIGSPLHLSAAADDFDSASFNVYRGHVMDALKEIYTAAYQRNPRGIVPDAARKISRIRDWDHQVIAPRFGFQSADHYYETQSAAPLLDQLKVESLYVGAACDPMILASSVRPYLKGLSVEGGVTPPRGSELFVHWDETAGHLGFHPAFDLGQVGNLGLEPQVLQWLSR